MLAASQLVAFVQLPEAHGGIQSAPAAGAGPAGAAAPGRKMTSSGSSSSNSSSSTEAAEAAEAADAAVETTVVATGVAVRGPEALLG